MKRSLTGLATLFLLGCPTSTTGPADLSGGGDGGSPDGGTEVSSTELPADLPPLCPPPGPYGTDLGDTVADLAFTDADGAPVSLHGLCGERLSLLYHYYGW